MMRELNSRTTDYVTVTLLWNDETDEVFIELESEETCDVFPVPADEANQAFDHPFVYAAGNYKVAA